jgi:Tfp pilus assembly protein PilV
MIAHASLRRRPRRQLGFTLMSVLIAIFLFGFGLLAILRSLGTATGASTQNQNVGIVTTLSNGFWGTVQASPSMLVDPALGAGTAVTFTVANITSAPAALRPWLYALTDTTSAASGVPPAGLPGGSATIQTFADTGSGTACALATGCSVKLTISWTQVASNGAAASTRSQTFYYQFGL